jgi:hypothetical protein
MIAESPSSTSSLIHTLPSGVLDMTIRGKKSELSELLEFATRRNPKRPFLFVSRVLGKHIPCIPSRMLSVQRMLAEDVPSLGSPPYVVVGMAETATALGSGVAYGLATHSGTSVLGLRTTRYRMNRQPDFVVDESHSHATEQLLYVDPCYWPYLETAKTLVLVDDEITTGRTFTHLGRELLKRMPYCEQVVCLALVNWLDEEKQRRVTREIGLPTRFSALLSGSVSFTPNPDWSPGKLSISEGDSNVIHAQLLTDPTRGGELTDGTYRTFSVLNLPEGPLTIIGDGEYMFPPFQLALALEQTGKDVLFQSTTRSPILPGGAIESIHSFGDSYGDRIENFIYNLACEGRTPVMVLEHPDMLEQQQRTKDLGAIAITLPPVDGTAP